MEILTTVTSLSASASSKVRAVQINRLSCAFPPYMVKPPSIQPDTQSTPLFFVDHIMASVIPESLTPANPATTGYRLNHTMLRITNPQNSLRFYVEFMGMSLIFTFNAGPFSVYYLSYPSTDDRTPSDIEHSMRLRSGLLELLHVHNSINATPLRYNNEQGLVGFGHLGFCVPDVEETLQRAEQAGWSVVKSLRNVSVKAMALPEGVPEGSFHEKFVATFSQVGFLSDPDG
jgi:lactoylglutathione lyase